MRIDWDDRCMGYRGCVAWGVVTACHLALLST
jgi:hypothetical protein